MVWEGIILPKFVENRLFLCDTDQPAEARQLLPADDKYFVLV
jgi:hypothetical protein